jgi:hypothetical protein
MTLGPKYIVIFALVLMGGLGASVLGPPIMSILGAAVGLGWSLLLILVAARIGSNERRRYYAANTSILLAAFIAGVLVGHGILDTSLRSTALAQIPQFYHLFARPPLADVFFIIPVIENSLLEWLLIPLALLLNWDIPQRRKLLIVAAVMYYAMRAWTYLHFAPLVMNWAALPAEAFTSALLEQNRRWVTLSWFRVATDALVYGLFLLAALVSVRSTPEIKR